MSDRVRHDQKCVWRHASGSRCSVFAPKLGEPWAAHQLCRTHLVCTPEKTCHVCFSWPEQTWDDLRSFQVAQARKVARRKELRELYRSSPSESSERGTEYPKEDPAFMEAVIPSGKKSSKKSSRKQSRAVSLTASASGVVPDPKASAGGSEETPGGIPELVRTSVQTTSAGLVPDPKASAEGLRKGRAGLVRRNEYRTRRLRPEGLRKVLVSHVRPVRD